MKSIYEMTKEELIARHTAVEELFYKTADWRTKQLDNENVSTDLYEFVGDVMMELRAERQEIECWLILQH